MSEWDKAYEIGKAEAKPIAAMIINVLRRMNYMERAAFMKNFRSELSYEYCLNCGSELKGGFCQCQNDE